MNKLIDSKGFALGELIYNLIVINLLILIGCFGVLTIGPSVCAGHQTVKALRDGRSEGLVLCFAAWYKRYLAKGSLLTLVGLLWLPVVCNWMMLGVDSGSFLKAFAVGLIGAEILMGLVGAFVVLLDHEEKGVVALIREGVLRFHCCFGRYCLMTGAFLTSVWLMAALVVTLPVAFSGSFYLMTLLRASRALKLEGDKPVNFLKVFEKTS